MRVSIENAEVKSAGIWQAKVEPELLLKLSRPFRQGGKLNVVLINNTSYAEATKRLEFDLEGVVVLNLGSSKESVLIEAKDTGEDDVGDDGKGIEVSGGDKRFLNELRELPVTVQEVGNQLFMKIRREFPGQLVFHEKSGKYVETPDNFWVVRIQPRVGTLRIVIYGRPENHAPYRTIKLKQDMAAYSSFVLSDERQVDEAFDAIKSAQRLKTRRR